ncbi:beta-hexosaminidase [Musa troglodytarum]|uniref:beta-N-acetylhexosaminidase n=1 Tax=Musa troglodytarum TaxID=320322 RepID=A0A9E7GK91_9LILI|nr:beta-hexosaminidase [Musa troglodytarum]
MPLAVGSWAREVLLCVGFLAWLFVLAFGGEHDGVNIWPMPKLASHGLQTLFLSKDFVLSTQGSKYGDGSGLLKAAFDRMIDVVEVNHIVDGRTPTSSVLAGLNGDLVTTRSVFLILQLNFGIDESYKLDVPAAGKHAYARIEFQWDWHKLFTEHFMLCRLSANCVILISIRELLNYSWLLYFRSIKLPTSVTSDCKKDLSLPATVYDADTSRHYLPLPIIKGVIDSMAYSKLNVLHWHIVDKQSFPLEIPSYPRLWSGAYSYSERYTKADALEIVQYAERRGVNVLAEIDVPGHARSWGVGYPDLWPSAECQEPLDVSKEFTFKVIDGILSDFTKVFKFRFVHLGGDEVNTSCWTNTPHISEWYVSLQTQISTFIEFIHDIDHSFFYL